MPLVVAGKYTVCMCHVTQKLRHTLLALLLPNTYSKFFWIEKLHLAAHDVQGLIGQTTAQAIKERHVELGINVIRICAT